MVDVHQRMGCSRGRPPPVQHQGDHQGGRQRPPGRHPQPRQLRQCPDGQLGGQGGKSRGVYPPITSLSCNFFSCYQSAKFCNIKDNMKLPQ